MSFHDENIDRTPPYDPGSPPWHSAVMTEDYGVPSIIAATFPVEVRDDQGTTAAVLIRKGEKGFIGKNRIDSTTKIVWYWTQFRRRGKEFFGTYLTMILPVLKSC